MSHVEAVQSTVPAGELHFLGNTICALRDVFRISFEEWTREYEARGGRRLSSYLPEKCSGGAYAEVWQAGHINAFPAAVTGFGLGSFFHKPFMDTLVSAGHFKSVPLRETPYFEAGQFRDPQDAFTVYGVYPYVLMIDHRHLGGLPVPCSWSDLLRPEYKDQIIAVGSSSKISELLLLTLYKQSGEDGIIRLADNVKDGWHGRVMVKTVESAELNPEGAAIYVIPWLFAQACKELEHVTVIWPEDGALVNPLLLLAQKDRLQEIQPVTDFVTGKSLAQQATERHFVMLHPEVDPGLPAGAGFNWLGWDFIRSHDLEALKDKVQEVFQSHWKYAGLKNSGGC
ncbi:ABC transporter substrate-binding protein ['Paenibacillus yunnanensis' Narsing Rao et al. 2020]|uniref:ABC transporter substrate-binding protein n=1 Tax=Paenibacillus tengchongensis TaxID=2608684 RepID=UPI00124F220F|nr:ABC transporter substrate-binding protein [Paenibacillus tengchongensis]